jgi:hypothetical protein
MCEKLKKAVVAYLTEPHQGLPGSTYKNEEIHWDNRSSK